MLNTLLDRRELCTFAAAMQIKQIIARCVRRRSAVERGAARRGGPTRIAFRVARRGAAPTWPSPFLCVAVPWVGRLEEWVHKIVHVWMPELGGTAGQHR